VSPVKIGTIGCGNLSSQRIYPCFRFFPIELVAVCDLDESKAKRNARLFGGETVYTDYRQMLAETALDGVIICVGPQAHAKLSVEVMRAGFHVYTEKPPATCAADATIMRDVSQQTKKICMTAFKKRFAPAYQKAKVLINSEGFGDPYLLSIDYASGGYANSPDNLRQQFLLDFTIHIIDLCRFLFGEVESVVAHHLTHRSAVTAQTPCTYAVNLRYVSGALGVLALTDRRAWGVSTEKVELTGDGSFITVENSIEMRYYEKGKIKEVHSPSFSTAGADSLVETGFAGEIGEFVNAIREGRQPESSIESAYQTMRLYEAIRDSNGAQVEIDK